MFIFDSQFLKNFKFKTLFQVKNIKTMKIYLVLISVIFATFSYTFSQKKELSLKDAVMIQRSLSPERITNFLWISDTEYSTCSKDWKTLFKNNVNAAKDVELLKIENNDVS